MDFLHQHHIQRLYIRYFDVVNDDNDQPMPNATIQFQAPIPQGIEVIPTVLSSTYTVRYHGEDSAKDEINRL